jgi:hypothetical protein
MYVIDVFHRQGGPSPRSCHKICFDPVSKSIFVLGRYVESQAASGQSLESDFYRYYVEFDQWIKINDNTVVCDIHLNQVPSSKYDIM